MGGVY